MFGLDFGLALSSWFKSRCWFITEGSLLIPLSPPNKQHCQSSRKGAETIPNQGSQAPIPNFALFACDLLDVGVARLVRVPEQPKNLGNRTNFLFSLFSPFFPRTEL